MSTLDIVINRLLCAIYNNIRMLSKVRKISCSFWGQASACLLFSRPSEVWLLSDDIFLFYIYFSCHTSSVLFLPDSTSTPNRNLLFGVYYSFLSLLHEVGFYVWLNHHLFLLLLYYYPSTSLCLSLSNRKKVNRKPEILAALGAVVVADPLVVGKWWGKQPNGLAS